MTELKHHLKRKLITPDQIENKVFALRSQKKRIATVNGSFDLMHAGHLYILFEAKKTADILIVALNSDSSVKAYKDAARPIIPLQNRLEMVSSIEFVDFVTWFDETDPRALLEKIKPDIHVNGIEYGENCIEAEVVRKGGGKLHLVSRIDGLATSAIIEKIQKLPSSKV